MKLPVTPKLLSTSLCGALALMLGALSLNSVSLAATLTGSTVNGVMMFHNGGGNEFNQGDGTADTTAVIGQRSPTFFTNVNLSDFNLSADFLANQLNISFAPYAAGAGFEGFQLSFQDAAFNGLSLSLLSFGGPFSSTDDFSYSLSGDTLVFNVIDDLPDTGVNDPYTATFSIDDVPEPSASSLMLLTVCCGLIGFIFHRHKSHRGSKDRKSPETTLFMRCSVLRE